jgi:hypothetical protein
VNEDYQVPFRFTGELKKAVIKLGKSGLAADQERAVMEMNREIAARE